MFTLLITMFLSALSIGLIKGLSYSLFSLGYSHNSSLLLNLSFYLSDSLSYSTYLCASIGVFVVWFVYFKKKRLA
jgi:nicotinamide riboside transporter PnuC